MCEYEYIKKHICKIWSAALTVLLCTASAMCAALLAAATPSVSVFASGSAAVTATIPVSVIVSSAEGMAGSEIPAENYTFRLTALNGAPMPENDTVTICGAGSAEFSIDYERVGVYQYTLEQVISATGTTTAGSEQKGEIDTTVYYVTVTVQNIETGEIGATVAAHRGSGEGDKCDIIFENTIEPETEASTEPPSETFTEASTEPPLETSTESSTEAPSEISTEAETEEPTEVITEIYTEFTEWYLPNGYFDPSSKETDPPDESASSADSSSPQTGDDTPLGFWLAFLIAGFLMTLCSSRHWKSRKIH